MKAHLDTYKLIETIEKFISEAGFECIEAQWFPAQSILRVFIDAPSGVTIDSCVVVSRLLQEVELIEGREPGDYELEVSSPGINRPVRKIEHFQRFIGQDFKLLLNQKRMDRKSGLATLVSVEGNQLNFQVDDNLKWSFLVSDVKKAFLQESDF